MPKKVNTNDCWLYAGTISDSGYGVFQHMIQRKIYRYRAHRVMYEEIIGKIPDGLVIDHLCRVRHCINPAHLEAVTQQENAIRGNGATGMNARKTHCPQGHPYDRTYVVSTKAQKSGKYTLRCCSVCINKRMGDIRRSRKNIRTEN